MILKSMCTQKAQKFFWQKTTFYDTELFFMCLLYVHTFDIWPGLRGFDIYLSFGLNRFLIYGFIKNPREGSWKSPFSWFLAFLAVFFAEKGCVFSTKNLVEKDSLFQQKIAKKAKNHENGDFHEPPRGFFNEALHQKSVKAKWKVHIETSQTRSDVKCMCIQQAHKKKFGVVKNVFLPIFFCAFWVHILFNSPAAHSYRQIII